VCVIGPALPIYEMRSSLREFQGLFLEFER
jgi:hypothetical protein